jgi:uncharacterized protein YecE (DUF72 family)
MEFGKVHTLGELNQIRFELPAKDSRETRLYTHSPEKIPLYLGCPSWNQPSFLGRLYPKGCSPQEYLFYYAQQLNTLELNTTFYRIPEPRTVTQWRNSTPQGFKFCPKVFQGISRFENLHEIPQLTAAYFEAISHFEDRLGPCFMQLPPQFSPGYFPILKRFLRLIPSHIQLSVEFRHPLWFKEQHLIGEAYDLLAERGVSTVITDTAGKREVLHSSLTTRSAVIRFVGNELHPSDFSRMEAWAQRLSEWSDLHLGPFFFMIHQPDQQGYIELIQLFQKALAQHPTLTLQSLNKTLAEPQLTLL